MELAFLLLALPVAAGVLIGSVFSGGDDDSEEESRTVVSGTEGDDRITYDTDADLLVTGLAGDDHISTGDGDDVIDGGEGRDFVLGGGGADSLLGGTGGDALRGEDGPDSLIGGAGDDMLSGNSGADSLWGGAGDDQLDGDAVFLGVSEGDASDPDYLDGGEGNDTLWGSDFGSDFVTGSAADADTLIGGAGDDVIHDTWTLLPDEFYDDSVPDADAVIDAGIGDDTIYASGEDTITTGAGADLIWLGAVPVNPFLDDQLPLAPESHLMVTAFTLGEDRLEISVTMTLNGEPSVAGALELREEAGDTIVSFRALDGTVNDAVVLRGVTGATLEELLAS